MSRTSKRLEFLLKQTAPGGSESSNPFAWYGLAMEYRALSRHEEALGVFEGLRAQTPDYVPMYLMCGQMLEQMGRVADAKMWLALGVDAARKKGDAHAAGELEGALAALGAA
jgi:hypothetical protein